MYIHIDTHFDLNPDMLHEISIEVKKGLTSGRCPYPWKVISDDEIKEEFGDKEELKDQLDEIESAVRSIKSTFNLD